MKKILDKLIIVFIIGLIFTGCVAISEKIEYRIREVEKGYEFSEHSIILVKEKREGKNIIGAIYLNINVREGENGKGIIFISTGKKEDYINGKYENITNKNYKKLKIYNEMIIIKNNGEKITIYPEEIEYTYEPVLNPTSIGAKIFLEEKLNGKISIEIGDIIINNKTYNVPKLNMQQYQEVNSGSVLRDLINSDPTIDIKPLYSKEEWIQ